MGPIRLNGRTYTRNSVAVRLQGVDLITGVESINWEDGRATELVQGFQQGGIPLGKAEGDYTCSADISLYTDDAALFEKKVLLINPTAAGNLARVDFQLIVQVKEDLGARLRSITIAQCNIKGIAEGVSNGGDSLVTKYTLQPLVILRDGATMANLIPAV